jgi:hypothetical protein
MNDTASAPPSAGELRELTLTRDTITVIITVVFVMSCSMSWGTVAGFCVSVGAPSWLGWLVGPSVDLSVIGLLVGIRLLSMHEYTQEKLRKPRFFLFSLIVLTITLNTSGPLTHHGYWLAAVDAIGPGLLLGWSEVGPWMLQQIFALCREIAPQPQAAARPEAVLDPPRRPVAVPAHLLDHARELDAGHRAETGRPISRDTLRDELRIGRDRASALVAVIRTESVAAAEPQPAADPSLELVHSGR